MLCVSIRKIITKNIYRRHHHNTIMYGVMNDVMNDVMMMIYIFGNIS